MTYQPLGDCPVCGATLPAGRLVREPDIVGSGRPLICWDCARALPSRLAALEAAVAELQWHLRAPVTARTLQRVAEGARP